MDQKVKIVPYVHYDGVPTFKDSDVTAIWDRMEEENTIKNVFQDGSIRSRTQFLEAMRSPSNFLILIYWEEELAAIMWANRFQGNFAQNHFCCFSNIWGDFEAITTCGRVACLYLLDNLAVEMLLGMIPEDNKTAIQAVVGAGGKVIGTLPAASYNYKTGKSGPTVVISCTKDGGKDENL